jgi:hypothetical protein
MRQRIPRIVAAAAGTLAVAATVAVVATPARAATPDVWGFGFVNSPVPPAGCLVDLNRQAVSSFMGCVTVAHIPVGRYQLRYPGIGAPGGVVHVMAVNDGAAWCQAERWGPSGPDEVVDVSCWQPGNVLADSAFTALFTASSGGLPVGTGHAYLHVKSTGGIIDSYNSSGAANGVGKGPVGEWKVAFPGLGASTQSGDLQATAVNPVRGARCKIAQWVANASAQIALVHCFDAFSNPLDTEFTISLHQRRSVYGALAPPKTFAYVWDSPGAPPLTNFNALGGVNSVVPAGTGLRLAQFSLVGVFPNTAMVTAYGPGANYCGMVAPWTVGGTTALLRDIGCHDPGGVFANTDSLITYSSVR